MRTVLITGANGFVGRHLSSVLLSLDWEVRGSVRTESASKSLVSAVQPYVVGNIDGGTDWKSALNGVDVVVHLAARVHVLNDTAADPLAAYREVNVDGT